MIVNGREIAEEIYRDVAERISKMEKPPKLTVFTCAPNFETQKYLNLKKKKADDVGMHLEVIALDVMSTTEDFIEAISQSAKNTDGIIVQLPLPEHIDKERVLAHIPPPLDIDALNPETRGFHSPVVGAMKKILEKHEVTLKDKHVTIIGNGKLVGQPAYRWCISEDAHVSLVTRDTQDISHYTKNADIIISGAGIPSLLKPDMIKNEAIVLDAGTSEDGGELRGDADPRCVEKCSLFTPVPGGIGPITIATLLQNVVDSALEKQSVV